MADYTHGNKGSAFGTPVIVANSIKLEAAASVYALCMVFANASGYAVGSVASASSACFCAGVAARDVSNASGAQGAESVDLHDLFYLDNDTTNPITRAMLGRSFCYAVDNHTVGSSSVGGSLLLAGVPIAIDSAGKIAVKFNCRGELAGAFSESPYLGATSLDFRARNVATSLAALTFTAGTFTADANGALGAQDGITNVVGDTIIFPAGTITTGVVSEANSGPWVLTAVGGASAKFTGIRPDWWAHGSTLRADPILVAAGTLYLGTRWRAYVDTLTTALVIGTGTPKLCPESVTQQVTLASGTKTISNVPIFATARIGYAVALIGGTPAVTTTAYQKKLSSGVTAGAIGTAAFIVEAQSVAGTIVNTDVAVLNVTLING